MTNIRAARPDDAGAIATIYAPYVHGGTISFEDLAPDAAAMRARMAVGHGLYPWLVATQAEVVVAYAYASAWNARSAYRWTVETAIYAAPTAHRRGTGRALYTALLDALRAQGFHQAIGRISLPNPSSIALHQALGFEHAGVIRAAGWKQGRWIDVETWQLQLAALSAAPGEPRHPLFTPAA